MDRDIVQRHIDLVFEDMIKISFSEVEDLDDEVKINLFDNIVEIRDLLMEVEKLWLKRLS